MSAAAPSARRISKGRPWARRAGAWRLGCVGVAWLVIALPIALFAAEPGVLRVGTSGDYAPFSSASSVVGEDPIEFRGFDIAVARAFASDHGLELRLVRFRWPDLLRALASDRFDVAMSGITVRPERSAAGRFSAPVAETGAVILGRPKGRFRELGEYNRRPVRIGVNAGGHLEQVAIARFPRATIIAIPDNAAVAQALAEGRLDAAVTDTLEAPTWMSGSDDLDLHGPFTVDRKAYLVRPDLAELAVDLDTWLVEHELDGTLAALRIEHFGAGSATAEPLLALLAAMDERLSLMPLVAVAKRRSGMPLEAPEREAFVLDAAVASARAAATRAGSEAPPASAVRKLFRAQMEAAKRVQWNSIRDPDFVHPESVPDITKDLRPALIRIGDRVANLLPQLPPDLDLAALREAAENQLRTKRLPDASKLAIAEAIAALSRAK